MNKLDKQYQNLLQDILDNGVVKSDRTGTGTISIFGTQIRHKMSEGFPLLTTKKMAWKSVVTELLWFLRGDTNIKFLVDNDCHIWDGDAYKRYENVYEIESRESTYALEELHMLSDLTKEQFIERIKTENDFAKKWGELGPIYGKQWRSWVGENKRAKGSLSATTTFGYIDQIQNLIEDLRTNPDSRRLMVSAWNVGELDQMVLPPCHYGFQVYTTELSDIRRYNIWFNNNYETGMERFFDPNNLPDFDNPYYTPTPKRSISLMWNQRSVDTFLGLPFNIASYGLLLEIIAKAVNMIPDELIGNLGDTHLYSNHIEQAKEQIGRKYTPEERSEFLENAMGKDSYRLAVSELMPFGGGMSEYYDLYKIPYYTRTPFELPNLRINSGNENWQLLEIDEIINSLDPDFTFKLENYQSHPAIKAPLSN
jgi:thymidylate synthase